MGKTPFSFLRRSENIQCLVLDWRRKHAHLTMFPCVIFQMAPHLGGVGDHGVYVHATDYFIAIDES